MPLDPTMTVEVALSVVATTPTGQESQTNMMTFTSGPFDPLGVFFPAGTRGLTSYTLTASSSATCPIAKGNAILNLDSDGVFELPVTMTATPLCGTAATLTVQVASIAGANGVVTSIPAGISCQQAGGGCSAVFAKGTQVTLSAQPSTAFAGWAGGSCTGTADCTFSLNQDTAIQAVFSTCKGWCPEPLPTGVIANLNAIAGTASNNILVVGDQGTALWWNGSTWSVVPLPQNATTNLYGAAAQMNSGSNIYVTGDGGTILAWNGASMSFTPITSNTTSTLRAVAIGHGSTPNIYFVGDGATGLQLPAGGTSASAKLNTGTSVALYGISQNPGNSSDDLYIGGAVSSGQGYARSWDGNNSLTTQMASPGAHIAGNIHAMLCGLSTDYGAGDGGALVRKSSAPNNSSNWQPVAAGMTAQTLRGMWESADNNVFVVGDAGTMLQYDGTSWTVVNTKTTANLRAVWGTSTTNIYAVGDNGTVLHYLP